LSVDPSWQFKIGIQQLAKKTMTTLGGLTETETTVAWGLVGRCGIIRHYQTWLGSRPSKTVC